MEEPAGEPIVIVSGLPRSGTSLVMQMLAAGGVPSLTDQKRAPDENNPRGYFEYEAVKRLQADAAWLGEARGHAVKIIHLLLRHLPLDRGYDYRVILMKRALAEILASQRTMLARAGKTAADPAVLEKIYTSQLSEVETWLGEKQIPFFVAEHRQLLTEPRAVSTEIANFLGRDLDLAAMSTAVDPQLYRERLA